MTAKKIALENRLRNCKNVITLGVHTNLSDYEDWKLELIRNADMIYYPTSFYAAIFDTVGKRTFPSYHTYIYVQDKIKQTALFNLLEIPHPQTRVFYGRRQKSKIPDHFQFPFVAKVPRGSALGRGVYFIQNPLELEEYIRLDGPAYIQKYVEIDRDLRVVVVGGRPIHAYWRIAKPGEFRTNVSQGGIISLDNIPDDALAFAVKVARMCRLDDVGLDIYCYQGAYGVLELNMKYGKEGFRRAGIDYYGLMDEMMQNGQI